MPARPAPSASAATPPTSTSTGSPAASAAVSVGHRSGSTPITRTSLANHAAIPPISPPPPTATITVSQRRFLLSELLRQRPLSGDDGRLVVRVQERRAGVEGPLLAGREGLGVEAVDHVHRRPVGTDPLDLHRGRGRRDEDLSRMPETVRRVGDGQPEVPARRGEHPRLVDVGREHPVERAARLEGAGVLQELQLEHESSRNAERPTFQLGDRCVSHPGSEQVAGALNVEPGDIQWLLAGRQGAHRG